MVLERGFDHAPEVLLARRRRALGEEREEEEERDGVRRRDGSPSDPSSPLGPSAKARRDMTSDRRRFDGRMQAAAELTGSGRG